MIAREWKCRCPLKHLSGFLKYLKKTGIEEASKIKGYVGSEIFLNPLENYMEITLITFWESLNSIIAFAGPDINIARLYPKDEKYEVIPDLDVKHYEVEEISFKNFNNSFKKTEMMDPRLTQTTTKKY